MINKTNKLVAVFDIDGTLINTKPKLMTDVMGAFARLGKEVSEEQINNVSGWYSLAEILGFSREQFDNAFDKRKSWEDSLSDGEAPLFEDTLPCLDYLANNGITLAALTRSTEKYTMAKLNFHKLTPYFKDRIAITPVTSKDKLEEARSLVKKIGRNNNFYFIGDKTEDVVVSSQIGLPSEGLYLERNYGAAIPAEILNSSRYHIIRSLDQVPGRIGV